jgi:hypothetical protein
VPSEKSESEKQLCIRITLLGRSPIPARSFLVILRYSLSIFVQIAKPNLRTRIALLGQGQP